MGKTKKWTLVNALEEIWSKADDCRLSEEFYAEVKSPAAYVKKMLGISPFQCFVISTLMDSDSPLSQKMIGNYAKVSNIKMMTHDKEFSELRQKKMIQRTTFYYHGDLTRGFVIDKSLLKAIRQDETYTPQDDKELSATDVLYQIGSWLRECDRDNDLYDTTVEDTRDLLNRTQHLAFSRLLLEQGLKDIDLIAFLIVAYLQAYRHRSAVSEENYEDILNGAKYGSRYIAQLRKGEGVLFDKQFLELENNNGVAINGNLSLTENARKTVMQEFTFSTGESDTTDVVLLKPDAVSEKKLYYNEREKAQVARLTELLSQEKFVGIQNRLKAAHLRPGFACLFYGSPGTGKTETVLQLCKATGRPVMQVNVSELKSKWVGESEKNVQQLFDQYSHLVKTSKLCPILLFNEADAIIGKRQVGAERAVEKMENSIQNIILQEMEKLEGILIATTNLTENMDDAFERRFLYKIRFDKPGKDVKSKIWQTMLPDLQEQEADELASKYDFSGGQIENIARKQTVDSILYDRPICLESICTLCEEEGINNKSVSKRTPIGFAC